MSIENNNNHNGEKKTLFGNPCNEKDITSEKIVQILKSSSFLNTSEVLSESVEGTKISFRNKICYICLSVSLNLWVSIWNIIIKEQFYENSNQLIELNKKNISLYKDIHINIDNIEGVEKRREILLDDLFSIEVILETLHTSLKSDESILKYQDIEIEKYFLDSKKIISSMKSFLKDYNDNDEEKIEGLFIHLHEILNTISLDIQTNTKELTDKIDIIVNFLYLANLLVLLLIVFKKNKKLDLSKTQLCLFQQIMDAFNNHSIISITDLKWNILYGNELLSEISWYEIKDLVWQNSSILSSHTHWDNFWKNVYDTINSWNIWKGTIINKDINWKEYYVDTLINPILDKNNVIVAFIAIRTNVTKVHKKWKELIKLKNEALDALKEQQKLKNEALESAIKEKEANEAKNMFLSRMSHELRTPLNSIIGFSELLLFDERTEDEKESISTILSSWMHLLWLINIILDLSKLQSKENTLNIKQLNIVDMLNIVVDMFIPITMKKNINFEYSMDNSISNILSDELKLKQVILNLLSNAVKFTDEWWRVSLDIKTKWNNIEFTVSDNGIWLNENNKSKVFDSFFQVDNYTWWTGLWLPICKEIVTLMWWNITVDSIEGEWSTFYFTVPNNFDDEIKVEHIDDLGIYENKEQIDWEKIKMIIAEDNPSNRALLAKNLKNKWINEYISVIDWKELIDKVLEKDEEWNFINNYEIIITDYMMWWGNKDWDFALKKIKDELWEKSPKIIVLTASALDWEKEKLLDLWFDWYLSKPFTGIDLFELIEELYINKK